MAADPNSVNWYGVKTRYVWDYGIVGIPVAGAVGSPQMIGQLYAPRAFKVVSFRANSIDNYAQIPQADTGDPNDVLCAKVMSPEMPGQLQDQTPVKVVEGAYYYIMRLPPSDTNSLAAGKYPYGTLGDEEGHVTPDLFKPVIKSAGVNVPFSGFPFNAAGDIIGGENFPKPKLP